MSLATIFLFVVIGIMVAVIALYLIYIAWALNRVSFVLGTVIIGVRSIEYQTEPVPKYVAIIMNDVLAIDQAAKQLLSWGRGPASEAPELEPARS